MVVEVAWRVHCLNCEIFINGKELVVFDCLYSLSKLGKSFEDSLLVRVVRQELVGHQIFCRLLPLLQEIDSVLNSTEVIAVAVGHQDSVEFDTRVAS